MTIRTDFAQGEKFRAVELNPIAEAAQRFLTYGIELEQGDPGEGYTPSPAFDPAPLLVNGPVNLNRAAHNNKTLRLLPGAAIAVAWEDTGNGFSCHLANRSGAAVTVTISGFTEAAPVNPYDASAVANDGMAAIMVMTTDGGVTRECWLAGDLAL